MPRAKIAITLDPGTLRRLDRMVAAGRHPSRSRAIEAAIDETLARIDRTRLVRECGRLDVAEEIALAEEGLRQDMDRWPRS